MVLLFIFFGLRHFRVYVNDYFSKSARCYFGNFIYNDLVALDLQFRFHCFSGFAWSFSCDVPCGQCSLWSDFDLRFFLLKCTPLRRIRHIRPYRSRLFRMRRRQFSGTQCHYALCFAWQVAPNSSENIFLRDENAARGRSLSDTPRVITRVVRHEIFLHCFCDLIAVVFVGVVFPCSAVRFRFFTLRVNFHSRTKPHTALSCFVQVRSQVTSQDPNNQNSRRCKLDWAMRAQRIILCFCALRLTKHLCRFTERHIAIRIFSCFFDPFVNYVRFSTCSPQVTLLFDRVLHANTEKEEHALFRACWRLCLASRPAPLTNCEWPNLPFLEIVVEDAWFVHDPFPCC